MDELKGVEIKVRYNEMSWYQLNNDNMNVNSWISKFVNWCLHLSFINRGTSNWILELDH